MDSQPGTVDQTVDLKRKPGGISVSRILGALLYSVAMVSAWLLGVQHGSSQQSGVSSGSAKIPVYSRQLRVAIMPLYSPGDIDSAASDWFTADELAGLSTSLSGFFPFTYEIVAPQALPENCFNEQTGQYMTDRILKWLSSVNDPLYYRTVGITAEDLSDADHNFLFGQALLAGQVCVASHLRITGSSAYAPEQRREMWHAIVGHELGHTLGLPHIENRRSLMCFANSLEEHAETGMEITPPEWKYLDSIHNIVWQHKQP